MKNRRDDDDEDEINFNNNDGEYSDESSESDSDTDGHEPALQGRKALFAAHANRADFIPKPSKQSTSKSEDEQPVFRNRQRVLLLSSRGITLRYRHLLKDFQSLLPHARKESKFDAKSDLRLLNEIADLNNCNNAIYFEIRKKQDLYLWMAKTPHGPSVKFLVQNVHTMDELKMTGNALKGSRPILSFDASFDHQPHFRLLKEMLLQIFGTPKGHRKSKPFFDHVISFTIADQRIWFRHYQMVEKAMGVDPKMQKDEMSLVEIGPRYVLTPIRIFAGSFGGPTLWANEEYVSPNEVRSQMRQSASEKYVNRQTAERERRLKMADAVLPRTEMDEVDDIFRKQE